MDNKDYIKETFDWLNDGLLEELIKMRVFSKYLSLNLESSAIKNLVDQIEEMKNWLNVIAGTVARSFDDNSALYLVLQEMRKDSRVAEIVIDHALIKDEETGENTIMTPETEDMLLKLIALIQDAKIDNR